MALLGLGILLVVVGLIMAFTNVFGFAGLGGSLIWLGWVVFAVGVVLAIIHFVMGPRRGTVIERRRTI